MISISLKNLIMINNPHKLAKEQRSHVVYQYSCKKEGCDPSTYIGYTECTLTLRMRNHAQSGSILRHNIGKHGTKVSTQDILAQTDILRQFSNKDELIIAEALLIKEYNPPLNGQMEGA